MDPMTGWEKLLIGVLVVVLLLWMGPGIKQRLAESRAATRDDWKGLLLPIGAVILFVILLISLVRK